MLTTSSQHRLVFKCFVICALLVGCGNKSNDEGGSAATASADMSASGAAAAAVGGALSGSSSGGTLSLFNFQEGRLSTMSGSCPTFLTTSSGCYSQSSSMWLTYSNCTFNSSPIWNGVQKITMSTGTTSCGSFPNPGAGGTLTRQFVASSGSNVPSFSTITTTDWSVAIDNSSTDLSNFDNQTIATLMNGGYGARVTFDGSGARSAITLAHRTYVSGVFDHTVTGSLTVAETAGASSRVVTGTVTVYHNKVRVVGSSSFTNVGHSDTCCLPTSGSITTTFSAGANVSPTALGSALVGKSETLTFNGCGTAIYTAHDGTTSNVTLRRCF